METKEIQLFSQQDKAIFAPQRFKAYVGGLQSGWGKTIAGAVWSRVQFDTFPQDDGLIAAPTLIVLASTLPIPATRKTDAKIVIQNLLLMFISPSPFLFFNTP